MKLNLQFFGGRGAKSTLATWNGNRIKLSKKEKIERGIYDERSGVDYMNFPEDQKNAIYTWSYNAGGMKENESLERYIAENPKGDISENLFRGIVMSKEDYNSLVTKSLTQEPIDMKGLASWSSNENVSRQFGGIHDGKGLNNREDAQGRQSVLFVAEGMKKENGRYLPTMNLDEKEVISSGKAKFYITRYKKDPSGAMIFYVTDKRNK